MKRFSVTGILLASILVAGCAFGSKGSADQEKLASLQLLLGSLKTSAQIKLRFYDRESNVAISTFTNGANAIVLTSPGEIEIDRLELWIQPNLLAGIFRWQSLLPVSELAAHTETTPSATTVQKIAFYQGTNLRDFFLTPNGSDAATRSYFGLSTFIATGITPGSITRVVLHIKQLNLTGTFNGTPFTVFVSTPTDPAYTPTCTTLASLRSSANIIPIFNYQLLFNGALNATSAHLESVIASNLQNTAGVLSEHFVLSCPNLN